MSTPEPRNPHGPQKVRAGVDLLEESGVDAEGETPLTTPRPPGKAATSWSDDTGTSRRRRMPEGMPEDPAEVVARSFMDALRLDQLLPSARVAVSVMAGLAGVLVLDLTLPASWAFVFWGVLLGVILVGLLPLGDKILEQAWRQPGRLPAWERFTVADRVSLPALGAMLLLALPAALGFLSGLGWLAVLTVPALALAIVWLMSGRLRPIHAGFPFSQPLSRRECAAVLLAGLMASVGVLATTICLHLGAGARPVALLLGIWAWVFTNRAAGVLARRYWVRTEALLEDD